MISDLHRRLRAATREYHERLERDARVVARAGAPASRRLLVEAFHRLHVEAEAVPEPWLDGLLGLDFERRRRLPTLRHDLAAVGGRSDAAVGQLVVTSRCEALGVLYVLGGSTLGGRVKPGRIDVTVGEHRDRVRVIVADQAAASRGPGRVSAAA
ncbi:MAG: biliverdin-producing heme oxygenase [Pseudomonadota bacterium]